MADYQDWKEVVFTKKKTGSQKSAASLNDAKRSGDTLAVKKFAAGSNKQKVGGDVRRLDAAEEAEKLPTISRDLRIRIQQARAAKGMTQKELATKINLKATIVQSYENGKAVPSNDVLNKMERALGCKLRGKNVPKKPVQITK
eukprot:TRINITY_DN346_c0_g1_i1.p2 TRINITY_DN346_c0_g1~~TRINITY_DN346_c0_g1_i1.p2  ORF type:complete len:143 (-),score=43.32 TRINITY_DN346_c0_g1_i1:33-461(-)